MVKIQILSTFVCFGHFALGLTNQDYIQLRDSIKEFIQTNPGGPDRNIPLLVRSAFHDVATANPSKGFGSNGCLLTVANFQNALGMSGLSTILGQLKNHVSTKFPATTFPAADVLSLAGKVAIEAANPCMKVQWSFGRPACSQTNPPDVLPSGVSYRPEDYYGPLQRYNLSFLEMGILVAGGHGLKGAASTAAGFSQKALATTNNGKAWLADTFNFTWSYNLVRSRGTVCDPRIGLCAVVDNSKYEFLANNVLRFPSDIVLFPATAEKLGLPARTNELRQVLSSNQLTKDTESVLRRFLDDDRSVFDSAFEKTYAKMLLVGVERPDLLTPFVETEPRGVCQA